jgi:hypothetical protein
MNASLRNWQENNSNRTEARLERICESDARHRLRITDEPKPDSFFERMRQYSPLESVRRWIARSKVSFT